MLEYAYNDSEQASTGATPFYLNTIGRPASPLTRATAAESVHVPTAHHLAVHTAAAIKASPGSARGQRGGGAGGAGAASFATRHRDGCMGPTGGGRAPRLLDVVHHDALRRAQEPSAPLQRSCSAARVSVELQVTRTGIVASSCQPSDLPRIMRLSSIAQRAPSLRPPSSAGPPPWRAPPGAPCTTPSASSAGACARARPQAQHARRQQAGALRHRGSTSRPRAAE